MICFFGNPNKRVYALQTKTPLDKSTKEKLRWLFGDAPYINKSLLDGSFAGPRITMVTPWSTNAVEITQNMGIKGILRIEQFIAFESDHEIDPMLFQKFNNLDQRLFTIDIVPEPVLEVDNIESYNQEQGLALNSDEVEYLKGLSQQLGRPLTDSEVFGFSQVNSEHCRHKIFNGTFVIDGKTKEESLFELIKKTSKAQPDNLVSAYKDNVAFIKGPKIQQFAPNSSETASVYKTKTIPSVISLKAETHNFPTTVEPFNGAATGSGGEIRDRMAGGIGSIPLAGTAVYMTAYSRLESGRPWEKTPERPWLYQTPLDILIKASNGASDFGNKFGQPLIAGSVSTFEHQEKDEIIGFDKVIMLAGGIGYGHEKHSEKNIPKKGNKIVVLGGDNYRIGMGGAAVSSANTGAFSSGIELNAVQRSNPEMQKRVANVIRAMAESEKNPIISIHDHGAGGHLNCLSELVEETGGYVDLDALPVGDQTLSAKEIIGNESQERMGLIVDNKTFSKLERIAARERAPIFDVGHITDDQNFVIASEKSDVKPIDLSLANFFGKTPKTELNDKTIKSDYSPVIWEDSDVYEDVKNLLQLEAVACKDWLTNKVDRCVTGRVAQQQTVGSIQLPLANCGVMALDFTGQEGIATSIGHAPVSALISPSAGSRLSIAEALTNIIWAPLKDGISSVSLSANWMWPCNNPGEDARLYEAVEACSNFAIALGINIPTGKDSLSMKQKYPEKDVLAPGTVIISATAHCNDVTKVVRPVAQVGKGGVYYVHLSNTDFHLGGSSFAQLRSQIGSQTPDVLDAEKFKISFNAIQLAVQQGKIESGHDVGSGGLITSLLEMCFTETHVGMSVDLSSIASDERILYAENPGLIIQIEEDTADMLRKSGVELSLIGHVNVDKNLNIKIGEKTWSFDIAKYRDHWFYTSFLMDKHQTEPELAKERFEKYHQTPLNYIFPENFIGKLPKVSGKKIRAAVIREKGSNSEREMAYAMHLAGFEVKDIHMTDLMSGREDLCDVQFIVAVGGFSNSDVLGSAKGWAGSFKYNPLARQALEAFFNRKDTLSLGVCNGCQLFIELGLLHPNHRQKPKMLHNDSGKFECTFSTVDIKENNTVMFSGLKGARLGIWSAHGEGKFDLPNSESDYNIVGTYTYDAYPSNPNGSDYGTAILSDEQGRHVVMMPHLERSTFPWNWPYYPKNINHEISPWIEAFIAANKWLKKQG